MSSTKGNPVVSLCICMIMFSIAFSYASSSRIEFETPNTPVDNAALDLNRFSVNKPLPFFSNTFTIKDKNSKGESSIELNDQLKLYLHLPNEETGQWNTKWSEYHFLNLGEGQRGVAYMVLVSASGQHIALSHQELQCMLNTGHLVIHTPTTNTYVSGISMPGGQDQLPDPPMTQPVMYLQGRRPQMKRRRSIAKTMLHYPIEEYWSVPSKGNAKVFDGWKPFQSCPKPKELGKRGHIHVVKYDDDMYEEVGDGEKRNVRNVKNDLYVWTWTAVAVVSLVFALMCCAVIGCVRGGVTAYVLARQRRPNKKVQVCCGTDNEEDSHNL